MDHYTELEEFEFGKDRENRRETYQLRKPRATRRSTKGSNRKASPPNPGGTRQRRNKHWNW